MYFKNYLKMLLLADLSTGKRIEFIFLFQRYRKKYYEAKRRKNKVKPKDFQLVERPSAWHSNSNPEPSRSSSSDVAEEGGRRERGKVFLFIVFFSCSGSQ